MPYTLYTCHSWYGSEETALPTIEDAAKELRRRGFTFKWDYSRGRDRLVSTAYPHGDAVAQVFDAAGKDVSNTITI